jgi:hypothetical protein
MKVGAVYSTGGDPPGVGLAADQRRDCAGIAGSWRFGGMCFVRTTEIVLRIIRERAGFRASRRRLSSDMFA